MRALVRGARAAHLVIVKEHPTRSKSRLNLLREFPAFSPHSDGRYIQRSRVAMEAVNEIFPSLVELIGTTSEDSPSGIGLHEFLEEYPADDVDVELLTDLFNEFGSDKASVHNYQYLYAAILKPRSEVHGILEIGLGTNNTDVVSNMGSEGKPGASLRAFREYLPNALIYGADVDARILFTDDRISTFHVDQTVSESLQQLADQIPGELNLVIDDGLHAPHANVRTLICALDMVRVGGWVMIEDIEPDAAEIWRVVQSLLPTDKYESYLVRCRFANVFIVRRTC